MVKQLQAAGNRVFQPKSSTKTQIAESRIDWVDYAKGICIVLVVLMHSTLGVEKAMEQTGWLNHFIEWAKPFRMPDFFLISGLFLSRRLHAPLASYVDTKIIHYLYFYILWMSIQFLFKGFGIYQTGGIAELLYQYELGFIEPFGTLWFIYLLATFFAVTRLMVSFPAWLVFLAAASLQVAPIETGWTLTDEFCERYVYFFAGYWLAPRIFDFATRVSQQKLRATLGSLAIWATANAAVVWSGFAAAPVIGLGLGFIGAAAVICMGVVLQGASWARAIRYLGANSIVVYLAFFVFMAGTRGLLIHFAPDLNVDAISLLVTSAGVIGSVLLHLLVKKTPLNMLFERPSWAKVETWRKGWHTAFYEQPQKLSYPETR